MQITANSSDIYGRPIYPMSASATLDFTFDWTAWLAAVSDAIVSAEVTADTGMVIDSQSVNGETVIVWLRSPPTDGSHCRVTCTITTAQGRTDCRTLIASIVPR